MRSLDNKIMDDDDGGEIDVDVDAPIEKDMTAHEAFIALKYANVFYVFFSYTIHLKAFCSFFTCLCCVTGTLTQSSSSDTQRPCRSDR